MFRGEEMVFGKGEKKILSPKELAVKVVEAIKPEEINYTGGMFTSQLMKSSRTDLKDCYDALLGILKKLGIEVGSREANQKHNQAANPVANQSMTPQAGEDKAFEEIDEINDALRKLMQEFINLVKGTPNIADSYPSMCKALCLYTEQRDTQFIFLERQYAKLCSEYKKAKEALSTQKSQDDYNILDGRYQETKKQVKSLRNRDDALMQRVGAFEENRRQIADMLQSPDGQVKQQAMAKLLAHSFR